ELEAYMLAVRARLVSRFHLWKAEGIAYAREREHLTLVSGGDYVGGSRPTEGPAKARKRGPKPDYATASMVAGVVRRVAPGDWRPKLDDICDALDEAKVPCPRTWHRRYGGANLWSDYPEKATAIKAIEERLRTARNHPRPTPEILS